MRSQALGNKIYEIKTRIEQLNENKEKQIKIMNKKETIIPNIEKVIETYPLANIEQKNKLLKSCIEKIEYYKPPKKRKADFEITIYPLF